MPRKGKGGKVAPRKSMGTKPVNSTGREFHPLADIFPLMQGGEFNELVADIKQHGLCERIVLYQSMILDGRNRYRACIEAGVEPQYAEVEFGDDAAARAFVIRRNILRRHLTREERTEFIAKLLQAEPEKSDRQVAAQVGVDHKTVGSIRRKGEDVGKIPHVGSRTDSKGRKQPSHKSRKPAASASKAPVEKVAATVVEPEGQPLVSTAVSTVVSAPTLDSNGRLSAPDYLEPPKMRPDGRLIITPGEKAAKVSAHNLAEFSAACHLYLPKVTVEEHRQEARLLVSKLTATKLKLKSEAHRETQH